MASLAATPEQLVQVCSNDLLPFAPLCDVYAKAAGSLGMTCTTIYVEQRAATAYTSSNHAGAVHYLSGRAQASTKQQARELVQLVGSGPIGITLCHRYRSYRVLRTSPIRGRRNLVVAHEFGLLRRWQRRLERRWLAAEFEFAGISTPVADELASVTGQRLVMPNGLDHRALTARLLPRDTAAATLLGTQRLPTDTRLTVGVIGRLHRKKRPQLALDAWSYANTLTPNPLAQAQLWMVGDGDLRSALTQQASAQQLPVTLCGFVDDAPRCLAALDVLLMTSAAAEAFGMVALEALAAGVPVVCPNIAGPAHVLGDLGFYFTDHPDPSDNAKAIVQTLSQAQALVQNADALAHWRQQAQQRVRDHFSITATAERLKQLLG